jgi:hypothetical protein
MNCSLGLEHGQILGLRIGFCEHDNELLSLYGCKTHVDLGPFFSFLFYTQFVGLLGRVISPSQGRYLHRETSMPRVGFEHTIPVFQQTKTGFTHQDVLLSHLGNTTSNYWVPDWMNRFIGYSPAGSAISRNTTLL